MHGADRGDVDDQRPRRARDVAADRASTLVARLPARASHRSADRTPRSPVTAEAPARAVPREACAPIAARSLRLTASARWPIASGGTNRRSKCTPSTCASVVSTSNAPRTGSIAAASSPGPTTTHGAVVSALSDASDERMLTAIGHCARIQSRRCDRANRVRAMLPTRPGEQIRGSAPLCRVGRSNEPAKAGGAAVIGRASGFLETEACTTRDLAARLVVTLAQTSLRKPSRAKQEPDDLTVRPGEGQERGLAKPPVWRRPARAPRRRCARDGLHVRADRRSSTDC